MKNICALFDMDGVLLDTESQYDIFWHSMGEKYNLGIEKFEKKIKGTTLVSILTKYFSHLPESEHDLIKESLLDFEKNMTFTDIPGVMKFISELKENNIKVGMVTSSDDEKLSAVFKQ
ncbi:MAG: HAD hydrolase-like protein, partial [Bacteroidota bacterium]|nr:HAD hydrolase-like protein [Bacteroidota bacterium]